MLRQSLPVYGVFTKPLVIVSLISQQQQHYQLLVLLFPVANFGYSQPTVWCESLGFPSDNIIHKYLLRRGKFHGEIA